MGMLIDIKKIEENTLEAIYFFSTPEGDVGKVGIIKQSGDCFVIEGPEWDKENKLATRVMIKLVQYSRKGEFPDMTCWAS